jgi:two-component system response regulator NreC
MHNPLQNLLQLCKELNDKSDEELHIMLEHMTFSYPEHLIHPIRLLLQNSLYINRHISTPPTQSSTPSTTVVAYTLSPREQQVLTLLAQGYTFPRIGEHLFISPATVSNHCARMREKLGLRGRNSLIAFAISKTSI